MVVHPDRGWVTQPPPHPSSHRRPLPLYRRRRPPPRPSSPRRRLLRVAAAPRVSLHATPRARQVNVCTYIVQCMHIPSRERAVCTPRHNHKNEHRTCEPLATVAGSPSEPQVRHLVTAVVGKVSHSLHGIYIYGRLLRINWILKPFRASSLGRDRGDPVLLKMGPFDWHCAVFF